MKTKSKSRLLPRILLLVLFLFLTSCANIPLAAEIAATNAPALNEDTTDTENMCMEPLFADAIPMREESFAIALAMPQNETALPPTGWENVGTLPISNTGSTDIIYARNLNGKEEIWFEVENEGESRFWVLLPATMEWTEQFALEGKFGHFVDNQSQLWVIGLNGKDRDFYYFNDESRELDFKMTVRFGVYKLAIAEFAYSNDNSLWLIAENTESGKFGLTRLDLETGEISRHLQETKSSSLRGISIDRQNRVFTYDTTERRIQVYDPMSGSVQHDLIQVGYSGLSGGPVSFYFTDDNRVWLNDLAWWINNESLSNLHLVFRSPIFVAKIFNGHQAFMWERPEPQVDTADGRIWYRSSRGLTWHQPETGEWCMFTTAQSNIVKDSEENLWIIYDNSLYMLPASETKARDD